LFGSDFTMIAKVFGGERSREQVKNKFRKEEKKNKDMIDKLLKNKDKVTLKDFIAKYGPVKVESGDEESSLGSESSSSSSSTSSEEEDDHADDLKTS